MINSKLAAHNMYYHELRQPLISLARGNPRRVLEIGCAAGQTLAYFKTRGAEYVAGIEISPDVAEIARGRAEVDEVLVGNIEQMELSYPDNSFDLIIAGHVLEHLVDPWTVLRRLHSLLRPGGQLIGALPNIRYHSVVLPLLFKGKWQYQQSGIMDWTHLRFFSQHTIEELLESTGFSIDAIVPESGGPRAHLANTVTFGVFRHLLSYAYNFSALKPVAADRMRKS
jgi:SAM-dependent methyltransferase